MAYLQGDIILDDHYNTFASDVNDVWGVGTGDIGYGQTTTLSNVAASNQVTATQWATLLSRISSAATHQNSSITSITSPTVGDSIAAYTALAGNITTITNNRLNAAAAGTTTANNIDGTGSWTVSTVHEARIDFAGGDEARYFFNAGGYLSINPKHTKTTNHSKNIDWESCAAAFGQIQLRAQSITSTNNTGGYNTLTTGIGYYDLTTSYQVVAKKFGSGVYAPNHIQVSMKVSAAHADGNGNNGSQVFIKVEWLDDEADTFDDIVDGTTQSRISTNEPSTAVLTNSWGTLTFNQLTNTQS